MKDTKIIRIGRVNILDQVEKRLKWGNSPKRISQSVKRVNGRTPTLLTDSVSSTAHALGGVVLSSGVSLPEEAEKINIVCTQ